MCTPVRHGISRIPLILSIDVTSLLVLFSIADTFLRPLFTIFDCFVFGNKVLFVFCLHIYDMSRLAEEERNNDISSDFTESICESLRKEHQFKVFAERKSLLEKLKEDNELK
jgi:hypothetical protein